MPLNIATPKITIAFVYRFGRIVKQYEDAIKRYKAGKPVPYEELPTPPGFGPLPGVVRNPFKSISF